MHWLTVNRAEWSMSAPAFREYRDGKLTFLIREPVTRKSFYLPTSKAMRELRRFVVYSKSIERHCYRLCRIIEQV